MTHILFCNQTWQWKILLLDRFSYFSSMIFSFRIIFVFSWVFFHDTLVRRQEQSQHMEQLRSDYESLLGSFHRLQVWTGVKLVPIFPCEHGAKKWLNGETDVFTRVKVWDSLFFRETGSIVYSGFPMIIVLWNILNFLWYWFNPLPAFWWPPLRLTTTTPRQFQRANLEQLNRSLIPQSPWR